ncbi:MAG: biotin--[acetyl-CoA-carboxylase] ligase [Bernardetiaceae bacterium]|nr:biotin--[acetyl-CoA-carboxylase] ligase [Bernardetiaceae bacterium]
MYLPLCQSTNQSAKQYIREGKFSEGDIVLTDMQTAGRGQRGSAWEAEPYQNLTFSLILKPHFLVAERQFLLNQISSLALIDAIMEQTAISCSIKWPNDIFYHNQKLSGMLIETAIHKNTLQWAVIGIGLNVNQKHFDTPRAVSLAQIRPPYATDIQINVMLSSFCRHFEKYYLQAKRGDYTSIKALYLKNLYQFQEVCSYKDCNNQQLFKGQIIGIDAQGKLAIATNDQRVRYFAFKEVEFSYS